MRQRRRQNRMFCQTVLKVTSMYTQHMLTSASDVFSLETISNQMRQFNQPSNNNFNGISFGIICLT